MSFRKARIIDAISHLDEFIYKIKCIRHEDPPEELIERLNNILDEFVKENGLDNNKDLFASLPINYFDPKI